MERIIKLWSYEKFHMTFLLDKDCFIFVKKILSWDISVSRRYLHFLHQNFCNPSKFSDVKFVQGYFKYVSNANANVNVLPDRAFLHFSPISSVIPRNPDTELLYFICSQRREKERFYLFYIFLYHTNTILSFFCFFRNIKYIFILFKALHKMDLRPIPRFIPPKYIFILSNNILRTFFFFFFQNCNKLT